jgi:hypothetical protein
MGQGDAALAHHLDEIAGAELKRQIPPDAQDADFLVKVPPFEEILCRGCSVIPAVIARHRAFQQFAPEPSTKGPGSVAINHDFPCQRTRYTETWSLRIPAACFKQTG